jgi:hypothetical protein
MRGNGVPNWPLEQQATTIFGVTMNNSRYTTLAIRLHWPMALLLVALFAVGIYMGDLPLSPWKLQTYSWHKWAVVTAFLLVPGRLVWRFSHRPPALPATALAGGPYRSCGAVPAPPENNALFYQTNLI